jgi:signal peptidase II
MTTTKFFEDKGWFRVNFKAHVPMGRVEEEFMKTSDRFLVLGATTLICTVVDQATKLIALSWLRGREPIVSWGNLFRFEYAENTGAFLGMGADLPDWERYLLLTLFSSGILIGLTVFLFLKKDLTKLDIYGYGLILAGGVSNMIDRIRAGVVIDFMNMGIGDLRTGIFNVADISIMGGLVLVLVAHFQTMRTSQDS